MNPWPCVEILWVLGKCRSRIMSIKMRATAACELTSDETPYEWDRSLSRPLTMLCDNQSAWHYCCKSGFPWVNQTYWSWLSLCKGQGSFWENHHTPRKGQDISYESKEKIADIFTKGVGRVRFEYLVDKLGALDLHSPAWGGVLE